jgi:hypothetical protein
MAHPAVMATQSVFLGLVVGVVLDLCDRHGAYLRGMPIMCGVRPVVVCHARLWRAVMLLHDRRSFPKQAVGANVPPATRCSKYTP